MSLDPSLHGLPPAVRELQADLIVEREVVGVVGAGTMGAGIAQLALENGHTVVLHDVDEAAVERGRARVREGLRRRAARLDLDEQSTEDWVTGRLAGLRETRSLDVVAAEAELVIEAALEDLGLKQSVFATLDAAAPPETILATNTSALSVAAIAARTRHPERVIGLHFFNPAPVMPLVEVVEPSGVRPGIGDRAGALVERWGKTPVRCADSPGFIVNRVNRPFTIQALRILESGLATVEGIDTAMRASGFPMGPFELMDLVGLDVNLATTLGVWDGLGRPDRLRPSAIQEQLVREGNLGRKTGAGFYRYQDGEQRESLVLVEAARSGEAQDRPGAPLPAEAIRQRILAAVDAEARDVASEGVATPHDIDLAMRAGAGHPVGPFGRMAGSAAPPD
jgi:3-hydroxybutyryl-CoA dehydrogenase